MSDFGGPESFTPEEGAGSAPEQLSEEARQRFQAAQTATKKLKEEEKRAKKRDDQVAKAIIQFLGEEDHAHLFQLIAQLVARDCPSVFILAILSLISESSCAAVDEYLKDHEKSIEKIAGTNLPVTKEQGLTKEMNEALLAWMSRLQFVMSTDAKSILVKLLIDEKNIDGTVLQLTTFILAEFFKTHGKELPFEDTQPLSGNILQTVFEPFLHHIDRKTLEEAQDTSTEETENQQ